MRYSFRILLYVVGGSVLLSACSLFGGKGRKPTAQNPGQVSTATGLAYNDEDQGGFMVNPYEGQPDAPNMVFIEGGRAVMGSFEEDVMSSRDNVERTVSVASFYMDRTEVANVHYREYLYWLNKVFDPTADPNYQKIVDGALPDTLVWRSELSYNEPLVEYYFRHPGFNNYPVVGVSWRQAHDYCLWRTDRVNQGILYQKGYIAKQSLSNEQAGTSFNTKAYLLGLDPPPPGKTATSKKNPLRTPQGTPRTSVTFEDGILLPGYRLPTEAEWEYAAYGLINQNPRPSVKEGKRGEELAMNKQIYPWSQNVNGLRDTRHGSWQGTFLANFKRGSGDVAGVAGGLNDRAFYTSDVKSFFPNSFGLYNMAGNVSEWVADVYRPMTMLDLSSVDETNPYRGNVYEKLAKNANGEYERDSTDRVKMQRVTDEESKNRRNYQRGNVINYLDGDSLSQATYGYGLTTLVSDKSRVYKGGSWNDRPYWLTPGARRFLEEDQSLSTLGFRCAMDRMGSPEGNKRKTGNWFKSRRQNSRKK